jgi:HEAT repeat protein
LDRANDRAALASMVPLTRDPKRQVRQFATFAVGRQREDAPFPDAIPILMERALEDSSPKVRRMALQILAYEYAHPDLCGFFQSLLDTEQDPKLHKLAGIGLWLSQGAGQ